MALNLIQKNAEFKIAGTEQTCPAGSAASVCTLPGTAPALKLTTTKLALDKTKV
jgi:hypothetical protein